MAGDDHSSPVFAVVLVVATLPDQTDPNQEGESVPIHVVKSRVCFHFFTLASCRSPILGTSVEFQVSQSDSKYLMTCQSIL